AVMMPLSNSTSLMFSLVTTVGTNSSEGVSYRVSLPSGFSPCMNWYATSAAASATILMGLEIVLYWSPLMMRWAAAISASLPVTGGTSLPAALTAAMVPLAVPSLAATTPTMSSPNWVIWPLTQVCAFSGLQSGVSYSASSLKPLSSTALWMPCLIRPAAASVGEPFTWRMPPSAFSALRWSTSDWPIIEPIFSLSKEM